MIWQLTDGGFCIFGTARGIGKETALMDHCAEQNIPPERVWAFGDDFSDMGMLEWAGRALVMASAPDAVKALGEILPPAEEGGVAQALEELF